MKFRLSLEQRKSLWGYVFILPWIIGFVLFFLTPLVQSFWFSMNKITTEAHGYVTEYKGMEYYIRAFTKDATFPRNLTDSVKKMFTDVPIILVFSFFAALLLKEKFRGNTIVKAIFFLPVILGSGVFLRVQADSANINSQTGVGAALQEGANAIQILQSFQLQNYLLEMGVSPTVVNYFVGPINKIFSVISSSGIQIFIFLAGLHSIPPSLFEACYIEGATGWEAFWKITFPMISPLILVNTIYTVVDSFTSYGNTTLTYIYNQAFSKMDFGYSSALAWIYFVVISGILGIVSALISKRVFYQN